MKHMMSVNEKSLMTAASIMVIAIVCFGVYGNALFNGFVYDDVYTVLENPWIKDIRYIPEIFSKPVWAFDPTVLRSSYYRPLVHIVYMVNYRFFGLDPWGFHMTNILFHTGVAIMVFILASRICSEASSKPIISPLAAGYNGKFYKKVTDRALSLPFIAALLFATHPIHTEAITWVSGSDHIFTLFYLLSLYFHMRFREGLEKWGWFSTASFFLALLFKETALTLPILLIAYDYLFKKVRDRLFVYLKGYMPFLIVGGVYFIMRFRALGNSPFITRNEHLSAYENVINVFPLFTQYLKKLFFPLNLNTFYSFHPVTSLFGVKGLLSLIVTTTFIFITLIFLKKNRLLFFSNLLIVVPLLPVFYIPGLGEYVFAERYLYLPSIGFVMLFSSALTRVKVMPFGNMIVAFVLTAVIGLYAIGTVGRNAVWKNEEAFYSDAVKKSPDAFTPHYNLAGVYMKAGKLDRAVEHLLVALALDPSSSRAYLKIGAAYMLKGSYDKAIEAFETAIPDFTKVPRFQLDMAYRHYTMAHFNLGIIYGKKGMTRESITHYEKVLTIDPDYALAHFNLAKVFADSGQKDNALEHYKAAVRLQPNNAFYRSMLGVAYGEKGLLDEAIEEFVAAVQLAPAEPVYRHDLERTLALRNATVRKKPE